MFGHLPVVFDSTTLAERDRFAFAREEYGLKALKVDLTVEADRPFRLRMGAANYGDVRVAVISSTPYRVSRTRALIADGDDRIGFVFPLSGRFGGEQRGRTTALGRGQATLMAANQTGFFGTATGGSFLTIRVPEPLVRDLAATMDASSVGVVVKPLRLAVDLIQSYLSTLNRHDDEAISAIRGVTERHLAELAVHAVRGSEAPRAAAATPADGDGIRIARAAAARSDIAAHFTDCGFDLATCAGHLGISVRYLQALLEESGTSFREDLQRRRLDHARRLLADPAQAHRRVIDIALDSGFTDVSHFNRQFRARFGDSPTGARAAASSAAGGEPANNGPAGTGRPSDGG